MMDKMNANYETLLDALTNEMQALHKELQKCKEKLSQEPCEDCIRRSDVGLMAGVKALEQEPTYVVDRVTIKEYLESVGTAYELGKEKGLDIALDILGKYTEEGNEKIIRDLPSVTPMQKWIPVSERLPEIHQDVILSLRSLDVEVGYRAETEPYFYCHGADGCYIDPKNVLAWMSLPQPYKAEGSEE